MVDVLVRHPRRAPALVLPVLVHQLARSASRSPASSSSRLRWPSSLVRCRLSSISCVAGSSSARPGRRGPPRPSAPRRCRRAAAARAAAAASRGQLERLDVDAAVRVERVGADAAVRGDVLVLLADRLAEDVDLDLAGGLGERARRDRGAARVRKRLQQADRVGARGAHAGAGGHVGDRRDLERVAAPVAQQGLAQDRVADLG